MRIGSDAHRELGGRTFIEGHRPFEPDQLRIVEWFQTARTGDQPPEGIS